MVKAHKGKSTKKMLMKDNSKGTGFPKTTAILTQSSPRRPAKETTKAIGLNVYTFMVCFLKNPHLLYLLPVGQRYHENASIAMILVISFADDTVPKSGSAEFPSLGRDDRHVHCYAYTFLPFTPVAHPKKYL